MVLRDVVQAWRTRRTLNCLCNEVQDFVNCEDGYTKGKLRDKFHALFKTVLTNRMYLEKRAMQLQAFIDETERRLRLKPPTEV